LAEGADVTYEPGRLAQWCELHEQIAALPEEEREVCELLWYQGLTQSEAAGVLAVSERTVKRRWQTVRLKLHEMFQGNFLRDDGW
jgi:RNA polymerase sigma-70 factor (ECF subfamily)